MSYFDKIKLAEFWKSSDYARREYVLPSPTKNMIERVQDRLGYSLPGAYIELMRFQNGGLPKNTCFPTNTPTSWAANHIAIHGIMGIGDTKTYSLCGELGSQFMIAEWGYPSIGIYFGDCPSAGHDMICLDYRTCGPLGEPRVAYVDQEDDYKITHLADNFELFICGLVDDAQFNEVDNESATEFIWRTDFMTASIQSYDCGQYLDLKQKLSPGDAGWTNKKLRLPKHWNVQNVSLNEGIVSLGTKSSGTYRLGLDNVGGLFFELLDGGADKSDIQLQAIWNKHAINGG
jgi:hypothetical protein